jgi:hypothetical protein
MRLVEFLSLEDFEIDYPFTSILALCVFSRLTSSSSHSPLTLPSPSVSHFSPATTSSECHSSANGAVFCSPSTQKISPRQVALHRPRVFSRYRQRGCILFFFFCLAFHFFCVSFFAAVFDDGSKKLTVRELFTMSAATRCIVQSLLILPASNDDDTLLLLPSLFVGSAAQLRSLLQVFFVTFSSNLLRSLLHHDATIYAYAACRASEQFRGATQTILPVS